jgi:hypothetical protein
VVDAVDYIRDVGKEGVCLDFFEGLGNGFGAEGAADLLESVEFRRRCVLD